jgi:hypothetical protein
MLPKTHAGWLLPVLLSLGCDHTLVVGDHGKGDVPGIYDAAGEVAPPEAASPEASPEGAADAPQEDVAPEIGRDAPAEATDSPSEASPDARDAALDAKPLDASEVGDGRALDADASIVDAVADRPRVPGCLPDGNGGMTFRSSGGEDLDVVRGNEIVCLSSVMGTQITLTDRAGMILSGLPALQTDVTFNDLARGQTGVFPVLVKITIIAGANPPVWTSTPTQCTADITTNAFVENEDGGALYEVGGSITCTSALAPTSDNSLTPLTISTFSFVTSALYP